MSEDYLAHHGIKGQKWGVRRFQNPDGSLTPDGQKRYNSSSAANAAKSLNRIDKERAALRSKIANESIRANKAYQKGNDEKYSKHTAKIKEYEDAIKAGDKLTKKLIADSKASGYTVKSIDKMRYTHAGQMALGAFMLGPGGAVGVGIIDLARSSMYGEEAGGIVKGTQYSVTRN